MDFDPTAGLGKSAYGWEMLGNGLLGGSRACFPDKIKFLIFDDPLELAIA